MTFSLPSMRAQPLAVASAHEAGLDELVEGRDLGLDEAALEVGVETPATWGAVAPTGMVQARTSLGPAVR